MGTQSVPGVIQAKLRRYCRAARARGSAGLPIPRALIVCEIERRRERIAALAPRVARTEGLGEETGHALLRAVDQKGAVRELAA
jgi:hypothetical protein